MATSNVDMLTNNGQSTFTNLYIKNFSKNIDETKLCQLFGTCGVITSCKIETDNYGESRGFGYINFEQPEMAQKAILKFNDCELESGKRIYVGPFQRKADRRKNLRQAHEEYKQSLLKGLVVYISNLDTRVDEKMLELVFSRFGNVTKTRILNNGKQSKGVAFINYSSIEEATEAVQEMNGQTILSKPIYVTFANSNNRPRSSAHPFHAIPPIRFYPPNTPIFVYVPPTVPQYQPNLGSTLLPQTLMRTEENELRQSPLASRSTQPKENDESQFSLSPHS